MTHSSSAYATDLIVAVTTPPGQGGVGIVRLSGPGAYDLARQIVQSDLQPRLARFCEFSNPHTGELIDQGIVLWFEHGMSFTGEEVIELHAHGSPVVLNQLVETCATLGARLARPGEFSERAFLNNKLDLAQAEAIADLIASGSAAAARAAARSLRGEFSSAVNEIAEQLEVLRIFVEAVIDFPDEEVEHLEQADVANRIDQILARVVALIDQARQGQLINNGVTVALIGPPNAGKSSLLNALSGEETAIVTDVPGTTRDVLKVDLVLDGVPVRLADTAGLRQSEDVVEQIGMQRTRRQLADADVILLVFEISDEPTQRASLLEASEWESWLTAQRQQLNLELDWAEAAARTITVVNKMDRLSDSFESEQAQVIAGTLCVKTAIKYQQGINHVKQGLLAKIGKSDVEAPFTARTRHLQALAHAQEDLQQALDNLRGGYSAELIAEELRSAHLHMGEIVGVTTPDDLLGRIFSEFCIGK